MSLMLKDECLMIKELRIMKTLRYLLIICTLTMAAAMFGQAQFKTAENKKAFDNSLNRTRFEFYSTSTLKGSGSSLPIAARNGFTVGATTPDDNSSSSTSSRRPRRVIGDGDDDIPKPDDNESPEATPVGEGMWVMMLLAAGYGAWMMRRVRAQRSRGESKTCTM